MSRVESRKRGQRWVSMRILFFWYRVVGTFEVMYIDFFFLEMSHLKIEEEEEEEQE